MSYSSERQNVRYRLAVPVEYGSSRGVTRDVSVGGIYFIITEHVEPGLAITFTLVLPQDPKLRIDCEGTVIRVEELPRGIGVAATIDCFESIVSSLAPDGVGFLPTESAGPLTPHRSQDVATG